MIADESIGIVDNRRVNQIDNAKRCYCKYDYVGQQNLKDKRLLLSRVIRMHLLFTKAMQDLIGKEHNKIDK